MKRSLEFKDTHRFLLPAVASAYQTPPSNKGLNYETVRAHLRVNLIAGVDEK